jgi:hypothetical protein
MRTRRFSVITVVVAAGLSLSPRQLVSGQSTSGTAAQITQDSILGHLEFLASDALQGRGSGTRDEEIAATYIGAYFRRLGLEPMADSGGYVQKIEVIREAASAPPVLAIGDRRWTHGTGVLVTALASARTSGPLHHFKEGVPVPAGAVVLMPPPPAGAPARLP